MDQVIQAVYRQMLRVHRCSVDVLESPDLRNEYLIEVRCSLGNLPEQQLLHRLTALRKKSKFARLSDPAEASTQDSSNVFQSSTAS